MARGLSESFEAAIVDGRPLPVIDLPPATEPAPAHVTESMTRAAEWLDITTQPLPELNKHGYPRTQPLPIINAEQNPGEL